MTPVPIGPLAWLLRLIQDETRPFVSPIAVTC